LSTALALMSNELKFLIKNHKIIFEYYQLNQSLMWKNVFIESCVLSALIFGGFYINITLLKDDLYTNENKISIHHISGFVSPHEDPQHISGKKSDPEPSQHISGIKISAKLQH
jgi:hypothetical protein